MTQSTFVKLLSQLDTLEPNELQKLSQAIQIRLQATTDEAHRIEKLYDSLLSSGLVLQRKLPSPQQKIKQPLIEIQGNPLSMTIIEERH